MEEQDTFPLDEAAIQFILQHDAEIMRLQARLAGMLDFFAAQHELKGNWRVAENKRELVRTAMPIPMSPERSSQE